MSENNINENNLNKNINDTENKNNSTEFTNYIYDMNFLVDCHTHILPGMDNGVISPKDSSKLIEYTKEKNIRYICMTPHFDKEKESIDEFLERREQAYQYLDDIVNVYLGAEVLYFSGISKFSRLNDLCIGKTKYILIEMPLRKWTDREVNEIIALRNKGYLPMLAHFERAIDFHNNYNTVIMKNSGVMLIADSEYFIKVKDGKVKLSKKAFTYFKRGYIDLIASNAHKLEEQTLADCLNYIISCSDETKIYSLLGRYETFCEALIKNR